VTDEDEIFIGNSSTQEKFEEKLKIFEKEERRQKFYEMALNMISKGLELEAYILMLATWNFAYFRYIIKQFDQEKFKSVTNKTKKGLGKEILNLSFEENWETNEETKRKIAKAFDFLSRCWKTEEGKPIIGPVGASKILHLMNPKLFIMWDTHIRKRSPEHFKITRGGKKVRFSSDGKGYVEFLIAMKECFGGLKLPANYKFTRVKAIDEYNYAVLTLGEHQ